MKRDRNFYDVEYERLEKSVLQIAVEQGTYANKIRRELKHLGYSLRGRSEALSVAMKNGRRQHPTKGGHKEETKQKIQRTIKTRSEHATRQEQDRDGD